MVRLCHSKHDKHITNVDCAPAFESNVVTQDPYYLLILLSARSLTHSLTPAQLLLAIHPRSLTPTRPLTCFLPTCLFVGTLAITLANPLVSPSTAARPTFARPHFRPTWHSARWPAGPLACLSLHLLVASFACLPTCLLTRQCHSPFPTYIYPRNLYPPHYGLTSRGYAPSICFMPVCPLTLLFRSLESQLATCLLTH